MCAAFRSGYYRLCQNWCHHGTGHRYPSLVATHGSNTIVKFADDTVVLGAISNNDEAAYMDEVKNLASWCRDNHLQLNVGKTKELVVDFRRSQHRDYKPIIINGAPVERVQSFKYPGVHISSDLTRSAHIQVQAASVPPTTYTGAVESILTQNMTFWYGNSCVKDKKRVIRSPFPTGHLRQETLD